MVPALQMISNSSTERNGNMVTRRTTPIRRALGTLAALALITGSGVAAQAAQYPFAPTQPTNEQQLKPDYLTEVRNSIDSSTLMNHVEKLSVDIGPRVTGTPAERTAAKYVGEQLAASGYEVDYETFPRVGTHRCDGNLAYNTATRHPELANVRCPWITNHRD